MEPSFDNLYLNFLVSFFSKLLTDYILNFLKLQDISDNSASKFSSLPLGLHQCEKGVSPSSFPSLQSTRYTSFLFI